MDLPQQAPATPADAGTVPFERHGAVTVLTLAHPQRRNALSLGLRAELDARLAEALADAECRVIVLTGAGGHFCSGGDIFSMDGVTAVSGRARLQSVHRIVRALVRGEKPVLAAVEGHAAGAGLCIAAACDVVVASREAQFSCSFNRVGLMPDLGGAWSLPLRMGLGRAKMLMLSGRSLGAAEAQAQGLVEVLAEPGAALHDALALAQEMALLSPLSQGMTKAVLSRAAMSLDEALAAEVDAQATLFASEDFAEGRQAFLEKRRPVFRGR